MPQAAPVPSDNSRIIMPYVPTPSEMKRRWVQTSDGAYASPELARDESGKNIVVNIDWSGSLDAAILVKRQKTHRFDKFAASGE